MRTLEQSRFHDHAIEARRVRAAQAGGVGVVREPEDRHVRIVVGDVLGIDPRDIRDHEIGGLDAIDRLEAMLREERLELGPEEEIDPSKQDRRHT